CARRLFVPAGAFGDRLLDRLTEAVAKLKVGGPFDEPQPFMGPVISAAARQQVLDAQQAMIDAGATALVEARPLAPNTGLLSPGLIDVTYIEASDDEVFGPLLQVCRYDDFDAAIAAANNTRYGLSAGLVGDDPARHDVFYR